MWKLFQILHGKRFYLRLQVEFVEVKTVGNGCDFQILQQLAYLSEHFLSVRLGAFSYTHEYWFAFASTFAPSM